VEALYGRRGSNLRLEIKCDGEDYMTAKKLYDKVLNEKLKKGYKHA
jgi:predicted DNA-binding WGR domain protein